MCYNYVTRHKLFLESIKKINEKYNKNRIFNIKSYEMSESHSNKKLYLIDIEKNK